ncbi:MAG: helix-turn-helix transcriptional regulator [Clostridia bacterium]|nr:helix-turn-helix transcriptional regulator [Clostridia bacterium]
MSSPHPPDAASAGFASKPIYDREPGCPLVNPPAARSLYISTFTLPAWDIPRLHYHNTLELGRCIAGEGECRTPTGTVPFREGDVELFFPFQPHYSRGFTENTCVWEFAQIDCAQLLTGCGYSNHTLINDLIQNQVRISGIFNEASQPVLTPLIHDMVEEILKMDNCRPLLVLSRLIELLVLNADMSQGLPPFERVVDQRFYKITPALEFLERNYMQDISMDQIAEMCGLSRTRTSELFRLVTGRTPKDYLNSVRINTAEVLLVITDKSIIDIGYEPGFGDSSSFYRAFKAMNGISPSEYRNRRSRMPHSP